MQLYPQHCPNPVCNYKYLSRKPHPKSCPRCKIRWDKPETQDTGKLAALRFIETKLISGGSHPAKAKQEAKDLLDELIYKGIIKQNGGKIYGTIRRRGES
jgi:hypothetical protein